MPILNIPKTYKTNQILTEQDLDNIRNSLLSFFNVSKLDIQNLQIDNIISSLTDTQVGNILDKASTSAVGSLLAKASQTAAENFFQTSGIYDTNSSETDTGSLTSSYVTKLTYSFTVTGTYLVTYGGVYDSATSTKTEVRLRNNGADTFPSSLLFIGNTTASTVALIDGTSGQNLTVQARRTVGSGGTLTTFLQVVRIS